MAVLIVEDGTGVANANTYASVAYARQYASDVGLVLPADDTALGVSLLAAMGYIESQPYQGQPTDPTQALQWPRRLATMNGAPISDNVIPEGIKKAQVQAANLIANGSNLFEIISGQFVTREKVGPIETEYSSEYLATWNGRTLYPAIDIFLAPYLNWVGGYRLSPAFLF